MNYLSICSGIEAATVAWHPLGWTPLAFAEIEPFPSAVLRHHYPDVPNLGDMTLFRDWPAEILAEVDVLVGGTPCQAFSVAGQRRSLDDERGNLTLTLIHLYDHITALRSAHFPGRPAPLLLWENVPGVLNTPDNAFGCLLGGLAGDHAPLQPPGDRWLNAGYVRGPHRAIGWRVLDAQYFALAQRRERVFLVAGHRDQCRPEQILFESESLRRDTPPSRQEGQGPTYDVAPCLGASGRGFERTGDTWGQDCLIPEISPTLRAGGNLTGGHRPPGTDVDTCETLIPEIASETGAGHWTSDGLARLRATTAPSQPQTILAFGGNNTEGPIDVAAGLNTNRGCHNPGDFETGTLLAFSSKDHGADAGPVSPPLRAMNHHQSHANAGGQVAIAIQAGAIKENPNHGPDGVGVRTDDCAYTLEARAEVQAIAFEPGVMSRDGGHVYKELSGTLRKDPGDNQMCVAFPTTLSNSGVDVEISPTLGSHNNGTNNPSIATFQQSSQDGKGTIGYDASGLAKPVKAQQDGQMIHAGMCVRRLTPRECERLQGFPDDYTLIPWRGKAIEHCPDGPRYKALGNSMATHVMHWLGRRIAAHPPTNPAPTGNRKPKTGN